MYLFCVRQTIKIGLSYFLLFVFLPSLILGNRFREEPLAKRFMMYLVFGNIYLSTLVFILAYLDIFTTFSLMLSTFLTSLLFYMLVNRKELPEQLLSAKERVNQFVLGEYGFVLLFARMFKSGLDYLKKLYNELIRENKIEWILFLLILSYSVYQYGINSIEYTTYMAPDEEVHLYWIQSLVQGDIFPSGVYPHVFHTVLAAMIKIFRINPMHMTLYFGITSNLLIMTMLYLGLRQIFKSKYAALLGFMLYTTWDLFYEQVTYRFQFTIPQEYGMIMLIPMALFLFDYLHKQKMSDLLFFGLALSLTIGIHFYTGAIALILAVTIGLTYFYKIIKEKMLFKLLLCGILSAILALGPLAVGLAKGYELEQSFTWGTEVIKGDIYSKTSTGDLKEDVEEDEKQPLTLERFLAGAKIDAEKYVVHDVQTIYIFSFIIVITLFYNSAYWLYKKGDLESEYQIAFALTSLLLLLLILFKSLNLPTIMEPKRLAIYFAYFSSFLLGMPLELVSRLFTGVKLEKVVPVMSLGVILTSLLFILQYDQLRPLPQTYYFQTSGTARTNMKIMDEYEDDTWTAVSPVNNISFVMNNGFHYELSEFILAQENWTPKTEIRIPTEYVFLYVEKRPIIQYGNRFYKWEYQLKDRPEFTKEDALKELTPSAAENYHYKRERKRLMAKAYYWAEEYKEYFPKEIDVYYEDSELIVYRIKQNVHALSNFSIDYKINKK